MTTKQNELISELFLTVQDHIDEIDRDLACSYLSNKPYCVALEDYSMGVSYNELEGVIPLEAYYVLSARPADCLRFTRAQAEALVALWNENPKHPRVKVVGQVHFYEELRKVKVSILETFKDCAPLAE
ncbi:MAG: hypothetical protein DELT_00515 [Desulfovibrio sp.]